MGTVDECVFMCHVVVSLVVNKEGLFFVSQ